MPPYEVSRFAGSIWILTAPTSGGFWIMYEKYSSWASLKVRASLKLNLSEIKLDTTPIIAQFQGSDRTGDAEQGHQVPGARRRTLLRFVKGRRAVNKFEQFPTEVVCLNLLVYLDLCYNNLETLHRGYSA